MGSGVDRSEIVFFDLETTIPTRPGQCYAILEFGCILVCPEKLNEIESYETLVKPHDINLITASSIRVNGITPADVDFAPSFSEIADRIYNILHGRIWVGHNILRFDCVRLREAYEQINKPPPEPKGSIDTLLLLTQRFGRRAGDMKMATLAAYFGLGQQSHRSLGDVRMNLEVVTRCAAVLFMESSQHDIFTGASLNTTIGFGCNGKTILEGTGSNTSPFSTNRNIENRTFRPTPVAEENKHPNRVELGSTQPNSFHVGPFVDKMESESPQSNEAMLEESSTTTLSNAFTNYSEFISPDGVSMASITVTIAPFLRGSHRIQIFHRNIQLQIRCDGMRIRFGLSTQFVDHAGRPRLSFVVDSNNSDLCGILDACDNIAKRFMDSDSNSEWRPVVCRKPGFYNSPTIRLHIPTVAEDTTRWITEIYLKESSSSSIQPFVPSSYAVVELESLIGPVTHPMHKDESKRGKNHKNATISGTVTANDNLKSRCNLRILVCDTNVESCHEVFTLLRQCSYQVTQAITLAEMNDAMVLEGAYTDIILCEVNLLLHNNGDLLKAITANTMLQHIPVIKDQVSLTLNGLGLGAADYLMSPVSADELLNLWTHILARS